MRKESGRKTLIFLMLLAALFCCTFSCTASAAQTNVVKSAQTVKGGRWVTRSSGKKYKLSDGTYAKNAWLKISGSIYYFNKKGICQTGWFSYNGNRYYADKKTGKLYVKKWKKTKNASYYLRSNGIKASDGWVKIKGKYYYFGKSGKLSCDELIEIDGKTYATDKNGVRITSSFYVVNGKTYYFSSKGVRVEGKWKKIKNKYYYFNKNGVLQKNKWIDNYYVGGTGARLTSCKIDGYYLDKNGEKTSKKTTSVRIFVGDSRTVGMSQSVSGSKNYFIAKTAMGYSWLKSTASKSLEKYLKQYSNAKVILALGVNDPGNISNYISYYKKLIKKYPDACFYIMSVNPVDTKKAKSSGLYITNSEVKEFNSKMKKAFPENYLDVYNYLKKEGYSTSDGVHYSSSTYKKIYDYVVSQIG